MAYIIGGSGLSPERKAAATARTTKRAGRPSVARKSKKRGAKRNLCWACGKPTKSKKFCKPCKRNHPVAVKAQAAHLNKAYGGQVPVVRAVPVVKAAKPRCPNPVCRAKGGRNANACARCGTTLGPAQAARAEKSVRAVQLSIVHSPAWWEAQAMRQHDPAEREACFAEARKAMQAQGTEDSSLVRLLVKASGSGSVREAWLKEADPHAREVLMRALNNQGGRSA